MLITTSHAARILNIAENTVRLLVRRGELPATRTSTGVRLFESDVVCRIAAERQTRRERAGDEAA
jgi:excisionase family DNA binding protein